MKNILAAILFLFSICAFGQSQGVSQRATNGISYGEMLVTGHINATNTSQTNTLAGKFQQSTGKATALGASAFGNNTIASGQYSVAIGSRGQNGGTSALSAGTSNTITSGGLNSFAVGAGNFISGSVSTAIGTNNFIEGYNNFGLGDSHQIDGSAGPDINNHIFLIGQSIDIPSPSAEVSSNLVVLNADPAGYTLIPPQSNSIYLNAPGGVFVNGSAISANLNPAALTNSDTRNIQFLGTFTRSNSANGNYASITDGQLAIGTTNQGRVVYFSQISTGLQIKADSGNFILSTNGNIYGSAFHGSDLVVSGTIVGGAGVTFSGIPGTRSNAIVYLDSDAKLTGIAGAGNGAFLGTSSGVPEWSFNGSGLTNLNGQFRGITNSSGWVIIEGVSAPNPAHIFIGGPGISTNAFGHANVLSFVGQGALPYSDISPVVPGGSTTYGQVVWPVILMTNNQTYAKSTMMGVVVMGGSTTNILTNLAAIHILAPTVSNNVIVQNVYGLTIDYQGTTGTNSNYSLNIRGPNYLFDNATATDVLHVQATSPNTSGTAAFFDRSGYSTGACTSVYVRNTGSSGATSAYGIQSSVSGATNNFALYSDTGRWVNSDTTGAMLSGSGALNIAGGAFIRTNIVSFATVSAGYNNGAAPLPAFKSWSTNNMIMTCPDGGTFLLRVANDGTLSAVTNTSKLGNGL